MTIRIEKIDVENQKQLEEIHNIAVYAFHKSPSSDELTSRLEDAKYRSESSQYLLYEENEAVAALTIHPLKQHLRGKIVKNGGVATVGTLPHARRKGHVRKLMQHAFKEMLSTGQCVSALHPFHEGYYQKFGYVKLPNRFRAVFKPEDTKSVLTMDLPFSTKVVKLEEVLERQLEFTDEVIHELPGMIRFADQRYHEFAKDETWVLEIYDEIENLVGMMNYSIEGYMKSLVVHNLLLLGGTGAKFAVMEFFAKHMGHVKDIKVPVRKSEMIDRWLNDLNPTYESEPGAMVRIIDLLALNSFELKTNYQENVSVRVKVIDEQVSENNGIYEISSTSSVLGIERSDDDVYEIIADIKALSALLFGYFDTTEMKMKGWLENTSSSSNPVKKLSAIFQYEPHEIRLYY